MAFARGGEKVSKSVLISIQPEWCKLIASGKKTVEIRKSRPMGYLPKKVYIYCTKGKNKLLDIMFDGEEFYGETYHGKPVFIKGFPESFFTKDYVCGNRKIIGEFICSKIEEFYMDDNGDYEISDDDLICSCLTGKKLKKYGKGNPLYMWRISNLVIYDKPKELADFGKNKPPQSWYYVNEEGL